MSFSPSVAFLGSVGTGEWIVLFVVILIVVGPKRMPEVARKIGRMMEMFRRAADEFKDQLMTMDQESHASSSSPSPSPAAPSADADGVSKQEAAKGAEPDPYADAYPNTSDYPGNEEHVENWSPELSSEQQLQPPTGSKDASSVAGKPVADKPVGEEKA